MTIESKMTLDNIQWHFIPPGAPHFGGIWEAGVKSIKYHLKRVIGETTLTFEEMSTLLYQIEACLNSRPLYPLPCEPSNTSILTPGHFLIGTAINAPPEESKLEVNDSILTRWKLVQKMKQDFWKSWQSEYLSRLQQRSKWKVKNENIKEGQIVLIKDENCPPTRWPLARVIGTHPGKDGHIRVVTLQYKGNTTIKRPITKICPLPIDDSKDNSVIMDPTVKSNVTRISNVQEIKKKKVKIYPISASWNTNTDRKRKMNNAEHHRSSNSKLAKLMITTLAILGLFHASNGQFTIKHPKPGLYIEQIGKAKQKRGALRVEIEMPLNITNDYEKINKIMTQMENICKIPRTQQLDSHCDILLEHLQEKKYSIIQEMDIIKNDSTIRTKRGLLGNILESVFGVNDEVYTNIKELKQDQSNIKQTAHHQSNIMVSILTQLNETEVRTTNKINRITTKLNQAISEISKIEGWYEKIDDNKIKIDILTAYQLSTDLFDEIENHYLKILETRIGQGNLLTFLSPSKLNEILQHATSKLPTNIEVTTEPAEKVRIITTETNIIIYGVLYITEHDTYDMIKVTPIPQKIGNHTYRAPEISTSFLATNYDTQTYFELTEEEFRFCKKLEKQTVLCNPTVINSIENNPNCVIDEIYHRLDKTECIFKEFSAPKLIWKHLYMANTWLFIADKPTAAAIKCKGVREDITLNSIGILLINQDCIVQTKRNTLMAHIEDKTTIKGTFTKPMNFSVSHSNTVPPQHNNMELEPVLKTSDSFFSVLTNEQKIISHQSMSWPAIKHHSITISSSVGATILIIIIFYLIKQRNCSKKSFQITLFNNNKRKTTECETEDPEFVIQTIHEPMERHSQQATSKPGVQNVQSTEHNYAEITTCKTAKM